MRILGIKIKWNGKPVELAVLCTWLGLEEKAIAEITRARSPLKRLRSLLGRPRAHPYIYCDPSAKHGNAYPRGRRYSLKEKPIL